VVIAVAPVVERDPDLQDAVIERAIGRARRAPEDLERLVLFEELAAVELLDGGAQLRRSRLVAACTGGLVDLTAGDALGPASGLALAATRWRVLSR